MSWRFCSEDGSVRAAETVCGVWWGRQWPLESMVSTALTSCTTLGKSLGLLQPLFPHLVNGDDNRTHLTGLEE